MQSNSTDLLTCTMSLPLLQTATTGQLKSSPKMHSHSNDDIIS